MKFRYILSMIVAALTLCFAGCQKEEARLLDEVKVSQSYIAIPAEGGQVGVTVNAVDNWEISEIPEWLTVSPSTGAAGETVVTFSAGATDATNEVLLYLNCAGASQVLNVFQMTEAAEVPITSCEVINASAEVGKIYRVKGAVTDITNYEKYGCFYVNDGTSDKDVYVYGSLNSDKFNVEVGDIITFEGPWTSYGNFDDVTIVELEKSLIKVEEVSPEDATLPLEGGEFTVTLTCKGDGISVVVPDEAKSWLSVVSVNTSGTEAVVTFSAGANAAGDRSADLKFVTTSGGVEYSAFTTLNQKGSIIDATIAEFLAAAESSTLYRVTGNIKSISVNTQYHNASVVIFDGAGNEVDLYRLAAVDANIEDLGLVAGDLITVVGKRSSFNGKPQMAAGGYVESFVHYVPATIEEFLAVSTSSEEIYRVSGKIVNIKEVNASYNNANLTIADEDGNELYLYRMKPAEGGKKINEIGFAVGDVLTVTGQRGEYNGSPQMINGVYVSHKSGSAEEEEAKSYTLIDKVSELVAGTYYMAAYLTQDSSDNDLSANPYHLCTGTSTDLYTASYAFTDGALIVKAGETYEPVDVVLEAVEGKTNTYGIKIGGKYLYSKSYKNRDLGVGDTLVEWVAADNANGGITMTTTMSDGTISIGSASATSKFIRSYKDESTLKYGLVFFKENEEN